MQAQRVQAKWCCKSKYMQMLTCCQAGLLSNTSSDSHSKHSSQVCNTKCLWLSVGSLPWLHCDAHAAMAHVERRLTLLECKKWRPWMMSRAICAPRLYQLSAGAVESPFKAFCRSPPCIGPAAVPQRAALSAKLSGDMALAIGPQEVGKHHRSAC